MGAADGPLKAAIARQEAITPHLLALVERATREIDRIAADETYMGHLYAFFLLAQFRERRAYPLIVDFFSVPGDVTLEVTGDFVTESLGQVLGSVSEGDVGPMLALAEDAAVNGYVRAGALDGLLCLFVEGVRRREEIIAIFRSLFRGGLEREHSVAWVGLVSASTSLYPEELMEEIRWAFAEDLIDEWYIDPEWPEEILARGKEEALTSLHENPYYHFVEDTIAEMEWWSCFEPVPARVGRDDPCPCGSGLTYRYCCWTPTA